MLASHSSGNRSSCGVVRGGCWVLFKVSKITDFFGRVIFDSFGLVGWGYLLSSIFASENSTDDISDWYGTC